MGRRALFLLLGWISRNIIFIGEIPDRIDENLENRVEMGNEEEENRENQENDNDGNYLEYKGRKIRNYSRNKKRKNNKNYHRNDRPDVHEKKSKINMKRNIEIIEGHFDRSPHRFKCLFSLEDDNITRVGKKYVYRESNDKIHDHRKDNSAIILRTRDAEEENKKCNDRKWTKNGRDILELEKGQKMLEALSNPIGKRIFAWRCHDNSSIFLATIKILFIFGDERYESSFKKSRQKKVTEKKSNRKNESRNKIVRVDGIQEPSKKFILLFENNNVRISNLVKNDTAQYRRGNNRRKNIKLLE
jgi:hypothetical protein